MVEQRLNIAYRHHGFTPPYPSYPFSSAAFSGGEGRRLPRNMLMDCARHRDVCLATGKISELMRFGSGEIPPHTSSQVVVIGKRFETLLEAAKIEGIISDAGEDQRLGELIVAACRCAEREQPA